MLPNRGAHAPANAVPYHGSAQYLADRKSDSRSRVAIGLAIKSRHVSGKVLPAVLVDRLEVRVFQ
jgi:hypothetical protein